MTPAKPVTPWARNIADAAVAVLAEVAPELVLSERETKRLCEGIAQAVEANGPRPHDPSAGDWLGLRHALEDLAGRGRVAALMPGDVAVVPVQALRELLAGAQALADRGGLKP